MKTFFRHKLLPALDKVADPLGLYTMYRLSNEERMGSKRASLKRAEREVKDQGFKPTNISATKRHPIEDITDSGSYRKVANTHPSSESRIVNNWEPEECQYHLHLFDMGDKIEYLMHYELRPDLFSPSISLERLRTHYKPEWGEDYLMGVKPPSFRIRQL
jgi:hypothetical protein